WRQTPRTARANWSQAGLAKGGTCAGPNGFRRSWPGRGACRTMVPMSFLEDRRRKRSDDPLVALHYQLAQARQEGRLEAIVIADDAGVVVAGAGAWAVCEELAAYAPLLAQGVWTEPGMATQSRVAELRTEVDVQPVELD